MNRLSKTLLITGCSSGIGHHVATQLKQRGHRVIVSCRKPQDVARLKAEGFDEVLQLDLDEDQSIEAAVCWIRNHCTSLDAVFHNAAYGQPGAVEDLPRSALRAQFETNLFGTHELTRQLMPIFRQQGHGRIIVNSSVLGLVALPFRGAYSASKFALEGLFDTLRLELAGSGIHVSLIEPGPIHSAFRSNALAALQKNIDIASSVHHDKYLNALERLQADNSPSPFCLSPEAVGKRVIHALESRSPQARYYVTTPTYLMGILRRLLPTRWLDRILVNGGE